MLGLGGIVSPMTINLETTKTAHLFVARGDTVIRGPFDSTERENAQRGVDLTNEELVRLGLPGDAVLAEATRTVSWGKLKPIAADEDVTTDGDTPTAPVGVDPAGPAAVQTSSTPTTGPGTYTTATPTA